LNLEEVNARHIVVTRREKVTRIIQIYPFSDKSFDHAEAFLRELVIFARAIRPLPKGLS
jgi:hypothetical protein